MREEMRRIVVFALAVVTFVFVDAPAHAWNDRCHQTSEYRTVRVTKLLRIVLFGGAETDVCWRSTGRLTILFANIENSEGGWMRSVAGRYLIYQETQSGAEFGDPEVETAYWVDCRTGRKHALTRRRVQQFVLDGTGAVAWLETTGALWIRTDDKKRILDRGHITDLNLQPKHHRLVWRNDGRRDSAAMA